MKKIYFSINTYDNEGDVTDECLLLHIDDTVILRLNDLAELQEMIKQLQNIENEIKRDR